MKKKLKQLIPDREKEQKSIEKLRNTIFESVWAQRKYTNKTSVTYLFYVMVTQETYYNKVLDSTEFSCHPVFRCKKCDNYSNSKNCCMIYVDETGRVYQNWKAFVEENVLPGGTMVAPRKGIYNFNENNEVILDIYCTPNGTTGAKVMSFAQTGSAVLGIGAACVPFAALALPIAAPVLATAGLIGLGIGAFTSITSVLNLVDRSKHEQSISITDSQARSSYVGVVGGAVGVVAAGATKAMTSMAAAGKATAGLEVFINGMNITSIVISGSGVASGVLDLLLKYNNGDKISKLDVMQLSASLFLFTHSVYNFQLASQIANEARTNSIQAYRKALSNRLRKMFDKMSKETMRICGNTLRKMDVIRSVNEIPDRQYLNNLFKVFGNAGNGILLKEDVKLLFTNGEKEHNIDMMQDPLNDINNKSKNPLMTLENLALAFPNGIIILLREYGMLFLKNIADGYKFQDVILAMAKHFSENTFKHLMTLAQDFIENMLPDIQQILKLYIPTESVLYRILKCVLNYYYFDYDFISELSAKILKAVKTYYMKLNPNNDFELTKRCPDCFGRFYVCNL
ncbi:uncharacterized protein ACRADG_003475 isoform 2-T3 [Cochliomyia hominivorax]